MIFVSTQLIGFIANQFFLPQLLFDFLWIIIPHLGFKFVFTLLLIDLCENWMIPLCFIKDLLILGQFLRLFFKDLLVIDPRMLFYLSKLCYHHPLRLVRQSIALFFIPQALILLLFAWVLIQNSLSSLKHFYLPLLLRLS